MTDKKELVSTVADKATDTAIAQDDWWTKGTTPPKAQHKILQTINFKLGTFDDENRSFMAIGSTPMTDRQGDVIQQDGWDLTNFLNNPVVPWAHDYYQPPVARAAKVGVTDGVLQFECQFPPEGLYPFADTIWNLYRNQYMFAFSVGFIPEEPEEGWNWEGNTFTKCELLEISAVVVPANPQALALAAKSGVIDVAQTKQLITKLQGTAHNLEEILAVQEAEVAKTADDALAKGDISKAVHAGIVKALSDLGISNQVKEKELTDKDSKIDNGTMSDKKDVSENGAGGSLTPEQHEGVKAVAGALKEMSGTLAQHGAQLKSHADTMTDHSKMVMSKADDLGTQADKLFDLLDHTADTATGKDVEGDGISKPVKKDVADAADVTDPVTPPAPDNETVVVDKPVEEPVATPPAAESTTEPSSPVDPSKGDEVTKVDGEVKSDSDTPADKVVTAEPAQEEPAKTDDQEAVVDAVKTDPVDTSTDGADHEGDKDDSDEEFDPDNLSDEQVAKILAAVNERVKKQ